MLKPNYKCIALLTYLFTKTKKGQCLQCKDVESNGRSEITDSKCLFQQQDTTYVFRGSFMQPANTNS